MMNLQYAKKILVAASSAMLLATTAYPQNRDIIQLQRDVLDLKNTVNQLQTSVDQKNQAILSLVEKMADQLGGLVTNVQKISQTVDNVNARTDKSATDLRTLVNTMNTRVNDMADSITAIRSQLGSVSQQITTIKTTAEPLPGPDESWRAARADVLVGNYDLALQELSDFMAKFPNDLRAAEAQLSKGDALSAQKKWDQAIIEYDTFLQKYPENDNTKTALYKKGLAQAEAHDPKAVATLQQVVAKYPHTVEAANAAMKLKELSTPGKRGSTRPNQGIEQ